MAKKAKIQPVQPASASEHIRRLIEWMGQGVYEKEQIIAVALLCAIAGENIFLLGPPGTAKSLIASRLKMVFKDGRSFDYLMSRFSTPDEIFGPISISRLKNDDRYERLTEGYLPDAHVVFLDEIWKAGPSIQNTLLTVINEHVFHNGGQIVKTPMKVLIAASNELPAKDEGLEALWDRFLMRMVSNCIDSDTAFFKMLQTDSDAIAPLPEPLFITDELYERWQRESASALLSPSVAAAIKALRKALAAKEKEDGNGLRFYVSDRRWRKAFRLMQTSAYLNGRSEIDISDYLLLVHSFWNDVECIPTIVELFSQSISDTARRQLDKVDRSIRQLMSPQGKSNATQQLPAKSTFIEYDYFYYKIENFPDGETYFAKWDYNTLGTTPIEGVKYFDSKRNKFIIHSLVPRRPFDAQALNATRVKKVSIEKWVHGAIIDGKSYAFSRHASDSDAAMSQPFYQRASDVISQFDQCVAEWEKRIEESARAAENIFLSDTDISILDKAKKEISNQVKALEVKINNVRVMM